MKSPRSGRPSSEQAGQIRGTIVDAATILFLSQGVAVTSMESVAAASGVSKRTLYTRFPDKPALLQAAIATLVENWLPDFDAALQAASQDGLDLASTLEMAGKIMLKAALAPASLALYRLLVSQSPHIVDLAGLLARAGAGAGIHRVGALLREAGVAAPDFAAEQFQRLVIAGPQQRALGFGPPMDADALSRWPHRCVALLLHGCLS